MGITCIEAAEIDPPLGEVLPLPPPSYDIVLFSRMQVEPLDVIDLIPHADPPTFLDIEPYAYYNYIESGVLR